MCADRPQKDGNRLYLVSIRIFYKEFCHSNVSNLFIVLSHSQQRPACDATGCSSRHEFGNLAKDNKRNLAVASTVDLDKQ